MFLFFIPEILGGNKIMQVIDGIRIRNIKEQEQGAGVTNRRVSIIEIVAMKLEFSCAFKADEWNISKPEHNNQNTGNENLTS